MAGEPSQRTRKVFRQRTPMVVAVLFGLVAGFLLISLVVSWAVDPDPAFLAWLLFAMAVIWAVFVRPSVVMEQQGVRLRNIVRDVDIPWPLVDDVDARWNVKVWVDDRAYTAWAISSQAERPDDAPRAGLLPARLDPRYSGHGAQPPARGAVTASRVAEAIRLTRLEYDHAVERGDVPAVADPQVRTRWVRSSLLLLAVPLAAALLLTLR